MLNTITNPGIRFLILAGKESPGHFSGKTLISLFKNGVDENMRVVGSPGRRPVLSNLTIEEVEAFRRQVKVIDMIGSEDIKAISKKIQELANEAEVSLCGCASGECGVSPDRIAGPVKPVRIEIVPKIAAHEPTAIALDKAGYFVIIPQPEKGVITVEHYNYDNKLERVIEGKDARSIYISIIDNGWVSQFSHAAYLGKELTKAELSMSLGFKYIQDGA